MPTTTSNKSLRLDRTMRSASGYEEWKTLALEHDAISGREKWKTEEKSKSYDHVYIRSLVDNLRELKRQKDDVGLLFALNEGIHGNIGGIGKSTLYERAKFGTKQLIEDYVDETVSALNHIWQIPESEEITAADKLDFFERASHCFGRSALMLSGAGSLGHFHHGVLKTLSEHGLLPNVISGSSAGSVFAAVVGCYADDELHELLSSGITDPMQAEIDRRPQSRLRPQVDASTLQNMLEAAVPDITFQEAYEKTGRCISITIAPSEEHQTSRLMNAVTSPNVFIRSAVTASCAVPSVFPPVMLMAKNVYGEPTPYLPNRRWVDGSVTDDLPAKRLARLYGVNHYIVSQANPLALALKEGENALPLPEITKNLLRLSTHEILKSSEKFSRRYLRGVPEVGKALSMFYSVMAQDYTGDVNIAPSFSVVDPQKLLGQLTTDEINELVDEGERATWAKLEQIRVCSKIGRALDQILDHHDAHNVKRFYKKRVSKKKA
ncbi:MAG: TAG lipase/steryl ester hydrolase/phospholipase A2/LPA acyltransferase [Candidatus Azotimanducaceae bacterium]|jgi:TAG lipase/steryl ester hydrolase/phospholipase A2/LPA acyltransferase